MLCIWLSFDYTDDFYEKNLKDIILIIYAKGDDGGREGMIKFIHEAIVSTGLTQRFLEKVLREITLVEGVQTFIYLELIESFLSCCGERWRDLRFLKELDAVVEKVVCREGNTRMAEFSFKKIMLSM